MGDFGVGALIGGGMSAIGSIFGASESSSGYEAAADTTAAASTQASQLQLQAQREANELIGEMWQQGRTDYAPFLKAGTKAVNQLSSLTQPGGQLFDTTFTYSDLYADPSYKWVKDQGINALTAKSAAAGNYGSGNMGTALLNFGTNLASTEYGNAWNRWLEGNNALYNRLAGIAGTGQTAASGTTALGSNASGSIASNLLNTASNIGNININAANNIASSQLGQANTWGNTISGLGNLGGNMMNQYMMYNLLGLV
jgi:hypothetical protein